MNGLIGRKIGMTQVFDGQGRHVPVTVIAAGPCPVVQRKTADRDGYDAVQVGFEPTRESRIGKPRAGHFKASGAAPHRVVREFRLDAGEDLKPGDTVTVDKVFPAGSYVDVIGTSKGQGYQGVVKRHRMAGGPNTHGHMSHRRIGAIGQRTWPARILKGKRMPGHMGHVRVTTQNLEVIQVRPEDHAILVRGAVPGPTGGIVILRRAVKMTAKGGS
jgi:large subunit ribosomal protein L3